LKIKQRKKNRSLLFSLSVKQGNHIFSVETQIWSLFYPWHETTKENDLDSEEPCNCIATEFSIIQFSDVTYDHVFLLFFRSNLIPNQKQRQRKWFQDCDCFCIYYIYFFKLFWFVDIKNKKYFNVFLNKKIF
jgi:hypothetical protein